MQSTRPNHGSSTMVMEMTTRSPDKTYTPTAISRPASIKDQRSSFRSSGRISPAASLVEGSLPGPTTASPHLIRWNHSRTNILRVLATFYSFIILGLNDAAYGALIPYMETYYKVNYTVISLIFLSPICGYTASAITNNMIHVKFGQRGIAIAMGLCHLAAYVVISLHPPFPVLIVVCILAGFGNGLGDSAWNAWIGDMANANEVLGFLHGFYGLGAAIAPLVATSVITKAGWTWYQFYYLMVGAAAIEVLVLTGAFWKASGSVYRAEHAQMVNVNDSGTSTPVHTNLIVSGVQEPGPAPWYIRYNPMKNPNSRTAEAVKNRVTLMSALFLLIYVGLEVSIGGWIVTFMLRVRDASPLASGFTATGFWLGVTVGRFVLGFATGRLFKTEKHAVACYLAICVVLQLLFWLVPQLLVSAVMIGLLGFFLAPMFPAGVVVITKLLPKRLHVAAIGVAAALGASGACIFPFAVGAIANSKGVNVLQPIVLALLVVDLIVWLCLPKLPKQRMA